MRQGVVDQVVVAPNRAAQDVQHAFHGPLGVVVLDVWLHDPVGGHGVRLAADLHTYKYVCFRVDISIMVIGDMLVMIQDMIEEDQICLMH